MSENERLQIIKQMYGKNFFKSSLYKTEPIFGWTVYHEDGSPMLLEELNDADILSIYDVDFH